MVYPEKARKENRGYGRCYRRKTGEEAEKEKAMKGILTFFALFFLCNLSAQVNNIYANAGIAVTVGAPTYKPGAKGSIVAIDSVTGTWYVSRDRYASNGNWLSMGQRIEQISGCSAPAYTPNKYNSDLVINNCAVPELYYHSGGGIWVQLNASGSTYTAGTGIAISGGNVISNTGDLSATNELNTAALVTGGNLRITDAGGNLDVAVSSIAPVQAVAAGTGISISGTTTRTVSSTITQADGSETKLNAGTGVSVSGAGTSGSPYVVSSTITQYTDELAQDAVGAMVGNTLTYTDATPLLDVKTQMSITSDASGVKLSGDAASPGNSKLYGTDGSGVKGWQSQPTGTTDLSISGSSSPLTINSSTGTDITATAGTGISLAGTSGNMTITNSAPAIFSGSIANTQVAYGSGTNTIAGNANLTWDGSRLGVTGTQYVTGYRIDGTSGGGLWLYSNITLNNDFWDRAGNTTASSDRNIGIGNSALRDLTSGNINIAIGVNALKLNQTGAQNVAIGAGALEKNVSGTSNFALGQFTLNNNTGSNNVGIGDQAITTNTSGAKNVGIGTSALGTNSTGTDNTAVGYLSLNNSTTSQNVAVGARSLRTLSSGSSMIGIGYFSGNNTGAAVTGSNDILIGTFAGDNITSSSNSIVIGHNIDCPSATTSNLLSIGNLIFGTGIDGTGTTISSGNIGIGVITPTEKLQVAGNIKIETAGKGLQLQSGTGQRFGNATLVGGTITVTNTTVGANSYILITRKTSGGTIGTAITYTISNGASFTINSDNPLDTSTFTYFIFEGN